MTNAPTAPPPLPLPRRPVDPAHLLAIALFVATQVAIALRSLADGRRRWPLPESKLVAEALEDALLTALVWLRKLMIIEGADLEAVRSHARVTVLALRGASAEALEEDAAWWEEWVDERTAPPSLLPPNIAETLSRAHRLFGEEIPAWLAEMDADTFAQQRMRKLEADPTLENLLVAPVAPLSPPSLADTGGES